MTTPARRHAGPTGQRVAQGRGWWRRLRAAVGPEGEGGPLGRPRPKLEGEGFPIFLKPK
jgi:hypothetical protein